MQHIPHTRASLYLETLGKVKEAGAIVRLLAESFRGYASGSLAQEFANLGKANGHLAEAARILRDEFERQPVHADDFENPGAAV